MVRKLFWGKRIMRFFLPVLLVISFVRAEAAVVTFTNEADYLSALTALSAYRTIYEDFEGSDWANLPDGTRSIESQGLRWTANLDIQPDWGAFRSGSHSFVALGGAANYTLQASGETIYGLGGWFRGNVSSGLPSTFMKITLDGNLVYNVELTNPYKFYGVIDANGFSSANIFTDLCCRIIVVDDVTVALAPVPIPATAWLFASAIVGLGYMRRKQAA